MAKNIKQWREEERPREKMLSKGCESLTSAELIAILIRSGSLSCSAVSLADEILELAEGRLEKLSRLTMEQLGRIDGIGQAKATSILAAVELGRRIASETPEAMPVINDARTTASIMIPRLYGLRHEECWVLYLNNANKLTGKEKVSHGGSSSTIFDIKTIVRKAVDRIAAGIILAAGMIPLAVIGSVVIGLVLLLFVNRKSGTHPYIVVLTCADHEAETKAKAMLDEHVVKSVVKSKSAMNGSVELNIEVRLKDDNTDFISKLSELQGVGSAVIVSYNGDYMG